VLINLHVAGGADLVIRDQLGVGGDFGFFSRLMTASATATWHVAGRRAADRALPFLRIGLPMSARPSAVRPPRPVQPARPRRARFPISLM
jgi:hypothetical protein